MWQASTGIQRICRAMIGRLADFVSDKRANFTMITALMAPVLIGGLGIGFETSNWYMTQRAMQNAADAAAVAAATNGGDSYQTEARAVTAQFGYTNGSSHVTVTASNTAPCPAGGNTCYSVQITGLAPLYMAQIVGFQGDTTLDGQHYVSIGATAIATKAVTPLKYCVLALGSSGTQGIRSNGSNSADLAGCSVMSDTTANCNGHDLGADTGSAVGTNSGCGVTQYSNTPYISDPYSGFASNIPTNTCSTYPQEPSHVHDPALPSSNQWTGAKSLAGNTQVCGDLQLTGDVTIDTSSSGAVLVINNGRLDTNGHTLKTSNGSALTLVFSGTSGSYSHYPTDSSNSGKLDFNAPTTGAWSGVAIYQNPSLTSGVDFTYTGNNPAWQLTGLVYLPHASVTMSGAVNKSSNGYACFAIVVDNITINGTAQILEQGQCTLAGLTLPTNSVVSRTHLVG